MIQAFVGNGILHLVHDHPDLADPDSVQIDPLSGRIVISTATGRHQPKFVLSATMLDAIDMIWTPKPTVILVHVRPYTLVSRKEVPLTAISAVPA